MKKVLRAAMALLLVLGILLGTAGCTSVGNNWSAKYDGEELPIGVYIYYLVAATNDALTLVEDTETSLLKQTIEDKPAEDWIRDKARYYVNHFFAGQKEMKDRGLALTEEEIASADATAASYWSQMSTAMDTYGVSFDSFKKVMYLQYQMEAIFKSIYLEGGEKEVPNEEIGTYFEENYFSYAYAPAYMYYYDEENKYNLLSEDEQAQVEADIQAVIDQFNSGKLDREGLKEELADPKYYTTPEEDIVFDIYDAVDKKDPESSISNALEEMENGKASVVNAGAGMLYIIIKHDITEETEEYLAEETQKNPLLGEMKSEEFDAYMEEQVKAIEGDITFNEKLLEKQKISKFIP